MPDTLPALRIGIAGLGNLGAGVARLLVSGLPGLHLAAAAGRDVGGTRERLAALGLPHVEAVSLATLPDAVDIVVECLTPDAAPSLIDTTLAANRSIVVASITALLLSPALQAQARSPNARILAPTGAILGLDVIRAAALGRIDCVTVRTRKPPASLGADVPADVATCLFEGNALDAVRAYPRNVNVAAAVALAGIGGERTQVEIWSDPAVTRNTHEVELESDTASVRMQVSNLPSPDNPKTSLITAQSIVAALQSLVAPVRIGS